MTSNIVTATARHLGNEFNRASTRAAQSIDSMIEALTEAKRRLADHPEAAPDVALKLGQEHAMLTHGLADLAAKHAAVEALRLVTPDA